MSWSIGSLNPDVLFTARAAGVILANGVEITDAGGWMHVDMPLRAVFAGAPCIVSVRLRLELGDTGHAAIEVRDILADGTLYARVTDLLAAFPSWAEEIGPAVHSQLQRCVLERLCPASARAAARIDGSRASRPDAERVRRFATAERGTWQN